MENYNQASPPPRGRSLRVLLADDHPVVAEGLTRLLESEVTLVGVAPDGASAVQMCMEHQPDIALLDLSMPGMNGLEAGRKIKEKMPTVRLIYLTMHADPEYIRAARRAGANGYVLKRTAVSELKNAIETVAAGETYASEELRSAFNDPLQSSEGEILTERQREVLRLIAEGCSAKQIATTLSISVKTAEFHRAGIMQRLGLHTTAELTRYALRHGIAVEAQV